MADKVLFALSGSMSLVIDFLPRFLGALVVFLVGWIVAGVSKKITFQILKIVQLEPFAEKVGLTENLRKLGSAVTPAELIADLVKWAIVIMFLSPAVEVLGLQQITVMMHGLLSYIPNVIVAVVIVMFGAIIADLTADFVRGTAAALEASTTHFLANLARYSILVFSILAALTQLRIAESMIRTLFTGLIGMVALAGGLAFGLGGKDTAAEILESIKRSLGEKKV